MISYTRHVLEELLRPQKVKGNFSGAITAISALEKAQPQELTFARNAKLAHQVANSSASIILVPLDFTGEPKENQCFFYFENPSFALAQLCAAIEKELLPHPKPNIHPTAVIAETAQIDPSAYIGPYCVIEDGVKIGKDVVIAAHCVIQKDCVIGDFSELKPRVTLYPRTRIGKKVILHSGCVLGSDGFGYETMEGQHVKLAHVGFVELEDSVEIGANTTIDRARFDRTVIGRGTKIDNLVQIGHNVEVGPGCILCSQVGVAGSTTLGKYVILAGQAGVAGHLHIGDFVQMGAQCGTASNLEEGRKVRGSPAMDIPEANRFYVMRAKIPQLFKRVDALEKKLQNNEQ